jgi:hypothetical protein
MTVGDVTGIITSATALVTALGGAAVSWKVLLPTLRIGRANHSLANNMLDRQMDRNDQLQRAMRAGGIDVPPRPGSDEAGEKLV